jgi:hypothetical protein
MNGTQHVYLLNLKCLFLPSSVALDIVLNITKKKINKIKLNRNSSKMSTLPQSNARGL